MFRPNVADQIHLIKHAAVNCYIIQDGPKVMLVDAGLPSMWKLVLAALRELGRSPRDISALVLTHGHFDHVGFAARLQQDLDVPVYVHPEDAYLAAHPYRYKHEKNRLLYPVRYPRSIPVLARMSLAGALNVKGVSDLRTLDAESAGTLPGRPELLHTPGHTQGHCALHFSERGTVLTGDSLVTLDPYTGASGPQIVSAAATADTHLALKSLDVLAGTGAETALPGHGLPYYGSIAAAVQEARQHGAT
ncbi:MBL fold metallo-hydrolase [Arthrobacter sp. B3I4]|uniref:MBL fold metallo-hydrolase n=1 Tax=Arthrobacter sp. B3I4 TaxID=3042267 RepID=UPI002783015D|nr:MBL fold metallo-hydrolase [Arthrobacter sp. B3I4]MDQ0754251.1 glyoxylase-like metal-dependent hydrolase (beta-lactamase superfamily II) [Arthrobacter sp. B3I4]